MNKNMTVLDTLKQWLSLLTEVGLSGLLDIGIVTLAIYIFLVAIKRTRRSTLILTGILIVGLVYLAARKLNLLLTVALLQGFFAVFLVALIVIFQEDIRYFFERVASLWLERGLPLYRRKTARLSRREVEILTRSLSDLARAKIGALVVIRGKDPIARHLEGGEEVQGLLSEVLLKSIFDPHSLGHDGAVVIDGDRIGAPSPWPGTGTCGPSPILPNWPNSSRPFMMKSPRRARPVPGPVFSKKTTGRRPCLSWWRRVSGSSSATAHRSCTGISKFRSVSAPCPAT
ncbi:MAG: diadenylate cyclase [Desulfobacterota bacterium]|nr:diadenylate cyclase [Thermodesulfobacteriota bacterium]